MKIVGLLVLHVICIYYLRLLWKDKHQAIQHGTIFTKMGLVTQKKSPRLFRFSVWVDFSILSVLYALVILYTIFLFFQ